MRKVIRLRTAADQILISGATLRVVREGGKITVVIDAPPNVTIVHEIGGDSSTAKLPSLAISPSVSIVYEVGGEVSELVVEGAEITRRMEGST